MWNRKPFYFSLFSLVALLFYSKLCENTTLINDSNDIPLGISHRDISKHVENIISIGNSNPIYEESRALSREYIRDSLLKSEIPQGQIFWNYFEWKEMRGVHNNLTTFTWRGINIIVWLNHTEIKSEKVRIFGAHYDTYYWGVNSTAGANNNLVGTALLIETAARLYQYQQQQMKLHPNYTEIPYLFVFFDHSEPGAIGSKTFVEHFQIEEKASQIGFFVNIDGVGYKGSAPFLQTYPYEHNRHTYYSPQWLVNLFVQAGYQRGVPLNVGNARKARSLLFQAYRYHLLSVPFGGDDGPFAWRGIPTAFLTDYDGGMHLVKNRHHTIKVPTQKRYFFEGNPHQHQVTDQLFTIGDRQVKDFVVVLERFVTLSHNFSGLKYPGVVTKIPPFVFEVLGVCIPGFEQYLQIGPIVLGFWELVSISLLMIIVVYQTSVYHYRLVSPKDPLDSNSTSESESGDADNEGDVDSIVQPIPNDGSSVAFKYVPRKWKSYKVLIVHLALMGIAIFIDTVFAFQMLLLGMLALSTIYVDVLWFLCGVLCANFLYKDFHLIRKFGLHSGDTRELKVVFLFFVYILHTFLLLVYGYDYRRKKSRQKVSVHQEGSHYKTE